MERITPPMLFVMEWQVAHGFRRWLLFRGRVVSMTTGAGRVLRGSGSSRIGRRFEMSKILFDIAVAVGLEKSLSSNRDGRRTATTDATRYEGRPSEQGAAFFVVALA